MEFQPKPNACGPFENTRNDKSVLSGQSHTTSSFDKPNIRESYPTRRVNLVVVSFFPVCSTCGWEVDTVFGPRVKVVACFGRDGHELKFHGARLKWWVNGWRKVSQSGLSYTTSR